MPSPEVHSPDPLMREILAAIDFRIIGPRTSGAQWDTNKLESPDAYKGFDMANTQIWDPTTPIFYFPFLQTPRLSTIAIAYIINRLVKNMPAGEVYLNVGTWCGWSLFSGILGNPEKKCIGVDNFSNNIPDKAKPIFFNRYSLLKNELSEFHEMDYLDYFKSLHADKKIGVYFYDGDHAYEHQYEGLRTAHPHLARGSYILVDDTNGNGWPYNATLQFIKENPEYSIVLDVSTAENGHPTFWNGLVILKKN